MANKFLSFFTGKTCCKQQGAPSTLPKGFEAASAVKNDKLRELLQGPDVTTSGGVHLVGADGHPLLGRQVIHQPPPRTTRA
jgi:hypothetical protein